MDFFHALSGLVVMNETKATPLVDVMLALLAVFIVTALLPMQAVRMRLLSTARVAAPKRIRAAQLTIDVHGALAIDRQPVALGRMEGALPQNAMIGIRFQTDGDAPYRRTAQAMAALQRTGLASRRP